MFEFNTVVTVIITTAAVLTALVAIAKFPVSKWLWNHLVQGPITEWAHSTTHDVIKPYADQNRVDHAEVSQSLSKLGAKVDGVANDVSELKNRVDTTAKVLEEELDIAV